MKNLVVLAVMSLIGMGAFAQDGHRDGRRPENKVEIHQVKAPIKPVNRNQIRMHQNVENRHKVKYQPRRVEAKKIAPKMQHREQMTHQH